MSVLKKSSTAKRKAIIQAPLYRKVWQLQEAKAQFSAVVQAATEEGPQSVTLRGEPTVVILSTKDYERLTQPTLSLYEFMQQSPLANLDINLERQDSLTRDVIL
jgi:antitoxin Phd